MGPLAKKFCFLSILLSTGLDIASSEKRNKDSNENCREELNVLRARLAKLEDKFYKYSQINTDSVQHGDITRRLLDSDLLPKRFAVNAQVSKRLSDVAHNQVILFGHVVTNIGQAYNPSSGVFRSQKAGVYLFSVTILVFPNKGAEFTLVKNGAPVGYIYAKSDSTGRDDSGSNTFIVELSVGDDVWVKIHQTYHDDGDLIDPGFSTFSGAFLY